MIRTKKPMTEEHKDKLRDIGIANKPYKSFTYEIDGRIYCSLNKIREVYGYSKIGILRKIRSDYWPSWSRTEDNKNG